jgi:hypothetical protein
VKPSDKCRPVHWFTSMPDGRVTVPRQQEEGAGKVPDIDKSLNSIKYLEGLFERLKNRIGALEREDEKVQIFKGESTGVTVTVEVQPSVTIKALKDIFQMKNMYKVFNPTPLLRIIVMSIVFGRKAGPFADLPS